MFRRSLWEGSPPRDSARPVAVRRFTRRGGPPRLGELVPQERSLPQENSGPAPTSRRPAGKWTGQRTWLGALLGSAFLIRGAVAAPPPATPEYEVKAAFLYNLAVLTVWPTNTWAKPDAPLVIGVLGADPFGPVLEKVLAGKKVAGRPVELRRYAPVAEVTGCHVLFVSGPVTEQWPAIREALAQRPILTVSDGERFCRQGGMVRLVKRGDGSIGLQANPGAAERANLKLSSRLLELASIQPTEP